MDKQGANEGGEEGVGIVGVSHCEVAEGDVLEGREVGALEADEQGTGGDVYGRLQENILLFGCLDGKG